MRKYTNARQQIERNVLVKCPIYEEKSKKKNDSINFSMAHWDIWLKETCSQLISLHTWFYVHKKNPTTNKLYKRLYCCCLLFLFVA